MYAFEYAWKFVYIRTQYDLEYRGIDVLDKSSNIDFQVHMDIGTKGATAEFISELEGWVTAYSFKYKIKPESYASSTIADKLSK